MQKIITYKYIFFCKYISLYANYGKEERSLKFFRNINYYYRINISLLLIYDFRSPTKVYEIFVN